MGSRPVYPTHPLADGLPDADMGTALSGGQKQRILLARALYKRPRLLFLDEATSHLDVARERQVNDAVRRLRLTRIVIAHRPETIAMARRVVRLDKGRVVQDFSQISPSPSPAATTGAQPPAWRVPVAEPG